MFNKKQDKIGKAIKVVHLPTDLGMRAYSLSRAERELGLDSWMIVRTHDVHDSNSVKPLNSSNRILFGCVLLESFLTSLKADVIMANMGSSLLDSRTLKLNLVDIPIYKILNKRIIVTFQGCDIRLCEYCPVRASMPSYEKCANLMEGYSYSEYDKLKLKRYKKWSHYADFLLGITPDLCRLDGIKYTPHAKYIDLSYNELIKKTFNSSKIRIAHMSRRYINGKRKKGVEYLKGTPWIEERLESLCRNFPSKVEYVPISGFSWRDCLKVLSTCDILIDQVLIGWYGGIAVESALLGILPIAYIDQKLLNFIPKDMRDNLPVLGLENKDDLISVLETLIHDKDRIRYESVRCHDSALNFHEAKVVARQIIENYYSKDN